MGQDLVIPALLIAMPQLEDPNFHQTVVLLLNHDASGSFGVVINRPSDLLMGALEIKERTLPPALASLPVWDGGPVETERIMFLVQGPTQPMSSVKVAGNVYLGGTLEFIGEKVATPDSGTPGPGTPEIGWQFRAFSGYSGWGAGQLAQELAVSSWLMAPFDPELIFATSPEAIWSRAIRSIGLDPSQLATETSTMLQ